MNYIYLALEKALEEFLKYGEKKIQEDGFPALDSVYLDVLADMLKEIKTKMIKYAEPIMILAKSILALKVRILNVKLFFILTKYFFT